MGIRVVGVAVAALLALGADDAADKAVKKDLAALQGSWEVVALDYNGKDMTANSWAKFKFVFKDDVVTVEGEAKLTKEYGKIKVKLDPAATPKLMDLSIAVGSQKDAAIEGIYELKEDELRICAKVLGSERPNKFESPDGTSVVLLKLKRVK